MRCCGSDRDVRENRSWMGRTASCCQAVQGIRGHCCRDVREMRCPRDGRGVQGRFPSRCRGDVRAYRG